MIMLSSMLARRLVLAGLVAATLAGLFWESRSPSGAMEPPPSEPSEGMGPVDAGSVLTAPAQPLPDQKRPPCRDDELEHLGVCWLETTRRPPCAEAYLIGSKCYAPVGARKKGPTVTGGSQ